MGRTMKRVPLDFAWPTGKVWGGYVNPFSSQSAKCEACDGRGESPEYRRLRSEWYGDAPFDPVAYRAKPLAENAEAMAAIGRLAERNVSAPSSLAFDHLRAERKRLLKYMSKQWCHHLIQADVDALVAERRLPEFTHRPRTEAQAAALAKVDGYWMDKPNGYTPSADEVNAWSVSGIAHDSINSWVCIKARMKREGIAETNCAKCHGEGVLWPSDKVKRQHDRWKATEPPKGDGFQLWETTSEGSPTSPVFPTMEELCEWASVNATTFGSNRATATEWRSMLDADFVVHKEGNAIFM